MKIAFLSFLLGSLGVACGQEFRNRVHVLVSPQDDCWSDKTCQSTLVSQARAVLADESYENPSTSTTEDTPTTEDGNVRGRRLQDCNPACVAIYGLQICQFYGWCRRRELSAATTTTTQTTTEDLSFEDLRDPCWVYQGIEADAAFTSLMPNVANQKDTTGVSFRIQVYVC